MALSESLISKTFLVTGQEESTGTAESFAIEQAMEQLPAFCIWKQGVMCDNFSGTSYDSIQFNVARYVKSCTLNLRFMYED